MEIFGVGLYLVLLILMIAFWLKRGGLSFDALMERNEREHHLIHGVIERAPKGEKWSVFQRWVAEARRKENERS